ncbi:MAG: FHA domain-containing protein [Clostridia bacterium]|nr:FHA domain-containing protein [Deltaproteobacteria bacterium]
MEARLVPVDDPNNLARTEVPLKGPDVTFGRAFGNVVVLDDAQVSKSHAVLRGENGRWTIHDLGSSNGTYVNGMQVMQHVLEKDDVLELGGCRFTFREVGVQETHIDVVPESREGKTSILSVRAVQGFDPISHIHDQMRLRGSYERVRAAFSAVTELIAFTDVRALCQRMLEVTFEIVRAETGVVLLLDANNTPQPIATRSIHGDANTRIMVSSTIVERVIRERDAVLATDALVDERFAAAASIVRANMRSVMCVPLIEKGRLLGLLHVGNTSHVSAFTQDDLELLTGIGAGASVAVGNALLTHQLENEARARETLGRFLSPVVVEQVLQNDVELERGGAEAQVTVLFADIRGFTSLTERTPAADVVALLNEYFDQMVEIVFRHGGILDKFIGDALMAVWGTPVRNEDDATRAVAAAQEMHETLESFNAFRRDRGLEPVEIGIGLASGSCIAGAIGARRRMDFTVIGDCVNLASRLAGQATAGQIVSDEATFDRAGSPPSAKRREPTKVKGKAEAVQSYLMR